MDTFVDAGTQGYTGLKQAQAKCEQNGWTPLVNIAVVKMSAKSTKR